MTISMFAAAIFLTSAPVDGSVEAASAPMAERDCATVAPTASRGFHKRPAALKVLDRGKDGCVDDDETRLAELDVRVFHKKPAALRAESAQS